MQTHSGSHRAQLQTLKQPRGVREQRSELWQNIFGGKAIVKNVTNCALILYLSCEKHIFCEKFLSWLDTFQCFIPSSC
jgi:hypothetical protein